MTPYKLAILFAVLFILLVATFIFRDRQGEKVGKPIIHAAPKPPMAVIRYGPDNEPYAMPEREWKTWKKQEVHPCIPNGVDCGAVFRLNGEVVEWNGE